MTYLSGLKDLIAAWDDRFVEENPGDTFRQSPQGNINTDGTSACADSPILTKYHRQFKKSIEPGVRDLAIALILKLNCITYSSCQGHFGTTDAQMRQRYVGILPRNPEEYQKLFQILTAIAQITNAQFPDSAVQVALLPDRLESEDCVMPCFNLFFVSRTDDEDIYFREIEGVYESFVKILSDRLS